MEAFKKTWKRLPLEGMYNARDLGGLPTKNGGQTAWKSFVRSDRLHELTQDDIAFLQGYGVTTIVDLRSPAEVSSKPDPDLGPNTSYVNISLMDFDPAVLGDFKDEVENGTATSLDMSKLMMSNHEAICQIIHTMAEAKPGCILFHCNIGKDRTGFVAGVLLMLAGVDRQDICVDYAQTREHLLRFEWYEQELAEASGFVRKVLGSDPTVMAEVYDYIMSEYGSIEGYLGVCGVSETDLAAVKARLVD